MRGAVASGPGPRAVACCEGGAPGATEVTLPQHKPRSHGKPAGPTGGSQTPLAASAPSALVGHRYATGRALTGDGSGATAPSGREHRADLHTASAAALAARHGPALAAAAAQAGVPAQSLAAVLLAEAAMRREPLDGAAAGATPLRFEPYVFWQRTGHWIVATHRDQAAEATAFAAASQVDADAARLSVRAGLAQIAGSEATAAGFADAAAMLASFGADEASQIDALARVTAADPALQAGMQRQDWDAVAALRAGPAWLALGYHDALALGAAAWAARHGGDDDDGAGDGDKPRRAPKRRSREP